MAKVYFDFSASSNGVGTSANPFNVITAYTPQAGDELYFRRGSTFNGTISLTAGLPGKRTKYLAWYYPDGSDEPNKPKPIFNLNAVMSTYSSTNKDNVELQNLDLRANSLTATADTSLIYLGHNSVFSNNVVDTNIGGVSASGKSNVVISYNTITAVKHAASVGSNNIITVADSKAVDSIYIGYNTITHGGGGGAQSHGIRCESSDSTKDMTNLVIDSNVISPPVGVNYNANTASIGIRIQRCPGAKVTSNNVRGMLTGLFVVGGGGAPISVYIGNNNFSTNLNFGIQLTTDTNNCVLEYNTCNYNGTNDATLSAYGRGIELTSAAGQGRCGFHTVRFNSCNYNKNYGGPADNGSEGVGIGLDDGCVGCLVYGNMLTNNEGNGIQQYGGGNTSIFTNTFNYIVANFFQNNCTASFTNRRGGGTAQTMFVAHVALAGAYGSTTHVANNVMVGGRLGVSVGADCANVFLSNNVMVGMENGINFDGTPANSFSNVFWKNTLSSMINYCTKATTSGAVAFTSINYSGTGDLSVDPQLDVQYKPKIGSPLIGTGRYIGGFKDAQGRPFRASPSIGMYEASPNIVQTLRIQ